MPYRDATASRLAARERQRQRRAKLKAQAQAAAVVALPGPSLADPVGELAAWAAATLRVPPGHPLAGRPMALPDFAERFLRDGWTAHESALSMARKNGKSAICAVLALGFLVGPLRVPGWRGAIASVSKEKAAELRGQVAAIIRASDLAREVRIRSSPYPGKIESAIRLRFDGYPRDMVSRAQVFAKLIAADGMTVEKALAVAGLLEDAA